MAAQSHRRPLGSSAPAAASSSAKRYVASSENAGGKATVTAHLTKKRPSLSNLTNQRRGSVGSTPGMVPCTTVKSIKPAKKGIASGFNFPGTNNLPASQNTKPDIVPPFKTSLPRSDVAASCKAALPKSETAVAPINIPQAPCSMDISPSPSDGRSLSIDDSTSSCDSLKSPEVEYLG